MEGNNFDAGVSKVTYRQSEGDKATARKSEGDRASKRAQRDRISARKIETGSGNGHCCIPNHVMTLMYGPSFEKAFSRQSHLKASGLDSMRATYRELLIRLGQGFPWEHVPPHYGARTYGEMKSVDFGRAPNRSSFKGSTQSSGGMSANSTLIRSSQDKSKREKKMSSKSGASGNFALQTKFFGLVLSSKFLKIEFRNVLGTEKPQTPIYCKERLNFMHKNIRFELPLDYRVLQDMTPIQYVGQFVRLNWPVKRRYKALFNASKLTEENRVSYIAVKELMEPIWKLFRREISHENYDILLTSMLFSPEMTELLTFDQFCGFCAFAERLTWTAFIGTGDVDTFTYKAANRKLIEYADFCCLKSKLYDIEISFELLVILRSLA